MAASTSRIVILLKFCKSLPRYNLNYTISYCRNCLKSSSFIQSTRNCSQFAEKAAQIDGNTYRLKDDDRIYVREGESPDGDAGTVQKIRHPPPHVQVMERLKNTRAFKVKRYQREGRASGIDPAIMWPTRKELEKMVEFEKQWCPTLQEMQKEIEEEHRMHRLEELRREKIIAANMAKMPAMLKEFDDKIEMQKHQEEDKKKKRAKMLEEARVKLGYNIDPRSHHFKVMMEEMEAAERKKKKDQKKKDRMMKKTVG